MWRSYLLDVINIKGTLYETQAARTVIVVTFNSPSAQITQLTIQSEL